VERENHHQENSMKLIIEVIDIEGRCPVYQVGHKIVLDEGYKINLNQTDAICMYSLASILPYHTALSKGVDPVELGLAHKGKDAYVQCLDPQKYTGGGTVTFKISRR
jgi:uncharacterized repeat protein (TIGR04076 family)